MDTGPESGGSPSRRWGRFGGPERLARGFLLGTATARVLLGASTTHSGYGSRQEMCKGCVCVRTCVCTCKGQRESQRA